MATIRAGDLETWYERSGGDGPTFVLTHGFAGPSSGGWPPVIEEFKRRFDLVLYDVRAHGRTRTLAPGAVAPEAGLESEIAALGEVTVPQFAADIDALMEALGIERAHIGGVSMGGMISAQFACDFPHRVRSLLLCDTVAGNGGGDDPAAHEAERALITAFEHMAHIAEKYGMDGLIERENSYRRSGDPYANLQARTLDEQDAWNRRVKTESMTLAGFLAANRGLRSRPDLTGRTPQIAAPTLVSCGEWDLFYPSALRDHRLIPGSRLVTIRGAAHATPDYRPELWLQSCSEFIAGVEAGRDVAGEFELPRT